MLIYRISKQNQRPIFLLEKTVCKPEWIIGRKQQGNLHAVHACLERNRVYLSFNNHCAIDIFDLDGKFLKRQYLWDIAPAMFPLAEKPVRNGFRFGLVRQMFETKHKELVMTIASLNGKKNSAVISFDNGRSILERYSELLHGGLFYRDVMYLNSIQKGEVLSFKWNEIIKKPDDEYTQIFSPQITEKIWKNSEQKTRGLFVQNNILICGVCYFRKPNTHQVPPRMVEFDLTSGNQIREHWLPSFQWLEEPHIYSILPLSRQLEQAVSFLSKPLFYRGKEQIEPIQIVRDKIFFSSHNRSMNNNPETIATKNKYKPSFKLNKRLNDHSTQIRSNYNPLIESLDKDIRPFTDVDINDKRSHPMTQDFNRNSTPINKPSHPVIIFKDVGLCFERTARKFLTFNRNLRNKKLFWALRDISFSVYEGETIGIIGRNGSGKSTLSMICSGVLLPDEGIVKINGKVQLLALGAGFLKDLSGRENVFINGSLLGLSKKEINARMEEIVEFAELGEFMDEPVRTYSSGMRSRLGFAVATAVKPDILILDEIMATGDKAFRDKAMKRMSEMRQLARSIVIVSHNPGQLRKLSTRVLWLEKGRTLMLGEPKEVLNAYDQFCQNPAKWLKNHPDLTCMVSSGGDPT